MMLVLFVLVLLGGVTRVETRAQESPAKLLPAEVLGWKSDGADRSFDAETIFDYIDGAGEVYRAYNMKLCLSRTYTKDGQPELIADFFDMGSAADAFGIFTHDLDGEDWGVGQGSVYKGGLLSFWKDRYYAAITIDKETDEAQKALLELGRTIAASIDRDGKKPDLLEILPDFYADPHRVRYLHSPVILNYHFFISRENVLALGPEVEALLAKAVDKCALVVVRYPDEARAAAALSAFRKAMMPGAGDPTLVQTANGMWTAADRKGRILAAVFHGVSADRAAAAVRETLGRTGSANRL